MTMWNDKQRAIIEDTSSLITTRGVESTSLGDIAKAVGISKGTLYYYYSSKADLIFDVTEYHFSQVTQGLLSWVGAVKDISDSAKSSKPCSKPFCTPRPVRARIFTCCNQPGKTMNACVLAFRRNTTNGNS